MAIGSKLRTLLISIFTLFIFSFCWISCEDDNPLNWVEPSDLLAIDSLVASKTSVGLWEQVSISAYTRGEGISFEWSSNHGSMVSKDSSTVTYWGCPSCVGLNIIECVAKNAHGMVSDTIMILVNDYE